MPANGPSRKPSKAAAGKVGPRKVGPERIGPAKIGPEKIGPGKAGPEKVGPEKIGADPDGVAKVGPANIGAEVGSETSAPKEPGAEKVDPAPATAGSAGAAKAPAGKRGATRATPSKAGATRVAASSAASRRGGATGRGGASGQRPAARGGSTGRPGRSIVSKPQRPWGLIVTSIVVTVFAVGVLVFAVTRHKTVKPDASNLYIRPEIASAKAITDLKYTPIAAHTHVLDPVKYAQSPPIGGNHSAVWADCSGVVYPNAIANENAVHTLEHGAVWITYRPGLSAADINTLSALVTGQNYTLMSPYPGLKTAISLQAWDYQLFVDSASDPRIKEFIATLRNNSATTPEYPGNCSNPSFKKTPSSPGKAIFS